MVIKYKNLHVQKENYNNFLNSISLEIYLKNNYFRNSLFDDFEKKISVKSWCAGHSLNYLQMTYG
jgi:hypothetical protein